MFLINYSKAYPAQFVIIVFFTFVIMALLIIMRFNYARKKLFQD